MIRFAIGSLAVASLVALGSLPAPGRAAAQSTYIPHAPQTDTLLYPPIKKDKRIIPGHVYELGFDDSHVPSTAHAAWHNRDYFGIPYDAESARLIPIVENGHLGLKTNPRGFWPYFTTGRYAQAVGELKYVLGVFVNHPRALHLLGICATAMGVSDIPIAYYEKAIRFYPKRAFTHAQYGTYLVDIGETMQGMRELNAALALEPDQPMALASLEKAKREMAGMAHNAAPRAAPPDSARVPRR
jgi:tetratricopeptide (TPR) repeat protein